MLSCADDDALRQISQQGERWWRVADWWTVCYIYKHSQTSILTALAARWESANCHPNKRLHCVGQLRVLRAPFLLVVKWSSSFSLTAFFSLCLLPFPRPLSVHFSSDWHILLIKTKNNNDKEATCRLREKGQHVILHNRPHSLDSVHVHALSCLVQSGHTNRPQSTTCSAQQLTLHK